MSENNTEIHQEVLYQKIGYNWHVFTIWNEEIYSCKIPSGIDPRVDKVSLIQLIEETTAWPQELKENIAKASTTV
jgi:hypothetical protein